MSNLTPEELQDLQDAGLNFSFEPEADNWDFPPAPEVVCYVL